MRKAARELQRELQQTKFPCWPNPSKLTVLLTRDLGRIYIRYIVGGTFLASALALAFARPTNYLLQLIGYSDDFVSSFPAFRSLYLHLSTSGITQTVNIADFHILDVFLWWWIIVLSIRLISGIVFLKQYDDFYQVYLRGLAQRYSRRRRVLGIVMVIFASFGGPFASTQPRLISDWKFTFLIRHYPQLYFWLVLMGYFIAGLLIVQMCRIVFWIIFRKHWPGVVIWERNARSEEVQPRADFC